MQELAGKRVLITGAASGIGRGAALAFARERSIVLLADIDGVGLARIHGELAGRGVSCRSYVADVSDSETVARLAAAIEREFGGLDVLVNVAGVCVVGDVAESPLEDWQWVVGVNLWGPINTIRAFLPDMIDNHGGHIVNVASLGGLVGVGEVVSYCTTKFALVGLSEALGQELRRHNIGVTAFCPGLTDTPIVSHARLRGISQAKFLKRGGRLLHLLGKSPEKTGEMIVRAVKRESPQVVTTGLGHALYLLKRLLPGLLTASTRGSHKYAGHLFGPQPPVETTILAPGVQRR